MKTVIPSSLKTLQTENHIATKFTKKTWATTDYVWFDGYEWKTSNPTIAVDPSDKWVLWQEPSKVILWLNVYPKSVQTGETKSQVDAIAHEGRVARVRLEVEKGRMDD